MVFDATVVSFPNNTYELQIESSQLTLVPSTFGIFNILTYFYIEYFVMKDLNLDEFPLSER
jgi:hypothetical protein